MIFYAQRKSIKNGEPITPNNRYGTRAEMERQFHLYCANSCTNADDNDIDSIEWGTIEQGVIERKKYVKEVAPEPTPEPEPEPEDEGGEEEPSEGE